MADERQLGFHSAGSRRLVVAIRGRAHVGVDEPLRFVVTLENDMGHDLGHAPLSALRLSATDDGGALPIETVGARPGHAHAVRVGRSTVGIARLHVEPADGEAVGALAASLGCSSTPFAVGDAARPGEEGARVSTREVEIGGALRGRPIRLFESRDGIHTQLWDAGLALARFLAATRPSDWLRARGPPNASAPADAPLAGLRILELGAGTGITALALGALGASVVATDLAPGSVALLRANAAANALDRSVRAVELGWGADCDLLREPFDVVLGADLVYAEDAFAPLVGTLRAVIARGALGLLACRRRCDASSEAHFFHLLHARLGVQRLEHARLELGVALYRLTPLAPEGRGPDPPCRYCEYLCARWARRFVEERAAGGAADGGWVPTDLLL
ncbi:hypothetical protein KFE25_014394 [Diacronema lutheri]|uniref:Methyltransferase domain-containing protein n=2 Tax=Diacronema lutheri TaxID=2081491 RepID=A0A8J6C668_DIALT|nr:hypothetical protein KFE25_014394 [Diacronema lutheri]